LEFKPWFVLLLPLPKISVSATQEKRPVIGAFLCLPNKANFAGFASTKTAHFVFLNI
jgi:hypothetical protein